MKRPIFREGVGGLSSECWIGLPYDWNGDLR